MPDYSYGKIYKIWTDNSDDVYIGSTIQTVSMRMVKHRSRYKYFLKTGKGYCTSYILLEQGAIHYKLIEKYPCENKQQLCKREGYWQKKITCVNKEIAGRTKKEYYQDNKLKISKYHKEYNKEYYQDNKLKISKKNKEYYQDNKLKILKRQKEYDQKNKLKRKEKHICICCDGKYTTQNWPIHQKTKKHVKAQKLQEQLQDLIHLYHQ